MIFSGAKGFTVRELMWKGRRESGTSEGLHQKHVSNVLFMNNYHKFLSPNGI
jgi:hypothetical protein